MAFFIFTTLSYCVYRPIYLVSLHPLHGVKKKLEELTNKKGERLELEEMAE
jgi:hypothetical protein